MYVANAFPGSRLETNSTAGYDLTLPTGEKVQAKTVDANGPGQSQRLHR